jgi:hypothetical protein
MDIQVGSIDMIPNLPSINVIDKIYMLPYNDDKNINKKLRKYISTIFKMLNEPYEIGFSFSQIDGSKNITVKVSDLIHDSNLDYFESQIRKYLARQKEKKEPRRRKIVIEI